MLFEKDDAFWYETLRSFGHIAYGGADFGEVLATARRITEGDYDGWHDAWRATADWVAEQAEHSHARGHRVSARDGYLRASNYYRCAEFFLHEDPADPRIAAAYERSVACFRIAAGLMRTPIEPVEIPYRGTTLPGYFYRADAPATGRTVVMHNGYDGSAEEMHFVAAAALAERGYHVLSFDGPGQPGPMHREGLVFRPDWENVIGPVFDYAVGRPEVDAGRVALLGNSMGGVLAPRAAAFEPRVAALIALDGVFDMGSQVMRDEFGEDRMAARAVFTADTAPEVDEELDRMCATDPTVRWAIGHGRWVTGTRTPRAYAAALLDYHVDAGVAERISCPTLVCSAVEDTMIAGQADLLFEHLTCPKTFWQPSAEFGAGAHCHAGAQRLAMARIGDWLDDTFAGGAGDE